MKKNETIFSKDENGPIIKRKRDYKQSSLFGIARVKFGHN